jgi:acyl-CoA dehydrogenase
MHFEYSEKVQKLRARLMEFMEEVIYPNEKKYYEQLQQLENRWTVPLLCRPELCIPTAKSSSSWARPTLMRPNMSSNR